MVRFLTDPPLRLLEYNAAAVVGLGVACSVAGPLTISHKEPAGHMFHLKVLRLAGLLSGPETNKAEEGEASDLAAGSDDAGTPASSTISDAESLQPPPGVSWKKSKGNRKATRKKGEGMDFYALLGLQHERWLATDTQLKNAYRRTCLECHPDKKLAGVVDPTEKERVEEHFKRIQEAYEVLSDPAKRREYDSTDDFDDTLPTSCDPAHFFDVFGPAFRRNARWSVDKAVPDLGGRDASWEQVAAFYDFWYGFKSWREFPHPDEEDVEGAESREHRRWIERLNAKLREKGKKEEARRLREFVDAAYRLDPRVLARREAERAERERKRAEREAARLAKQADEEAARAAAEAQRAADEAAAREAAAKAKAQREAEKKLLKKERQRLRALSVGDAGMRLLSEDDVERLASGLDLAQLTKLNDAASAAGISSTVATGQVLRDGLAALAARQDAEARAKEAAKKEALTALKDMAKRDHARRVAAMAEWSDEELRLLDKAVAKFPQGTPKRWEQVAAYIRTRPLQEVLLMVKERQGASSARLRQQEDWKGAAKKRAEVVASADMRAQAFSDVDVKLAGQAAQVVAGSGMGSGATMASAPVSPGDGAGSEARTSSSTTAHADNSRGRCAGDGTNLVVSAESGAWTELQELALVQALKECSKELSDRWAEVAKRVPGKSKRECFARFKELKQVFAAKKAATT